MGIDDRLDPATGMRPAIGTEFARSLPELNRIRESVAAQTAPPVVLNPPHELEMARPDGAPARVLLWRIPAAPRGVPVSCKGHYWGRNGEKLCGLPLHKLDTLRAQSALHDWSAAVVTQDWALLSAPAIARARELYARRYASKPDIVQEMRGQAVAVSAFIGAGVHGGLTRAALVLLGLPNGCQPVGRANATHQLAAAGPPKRTCDAPAFRTAAAVVHRRLDCPHPHSAICCAA